MSPQVIDSFEDPRLIPYRDIRHRDPVDHGRRFIAEGKLVVERLLQSRLGCESILVERGHHREIVAKACCGSRPPAILEADLATLRGIVGYDFHRGILACGIHDPFLPLAQLPRPAPGDRPLLVVCGVNNPENIGGLMRTAAAFGVQRMALTSDTAHPFSRRALRVSMGAAMEIEFYHFAPESTSVCWLHEELGYRTLATALSPAATELDKYSPDDRCEAVFVGNEAEGLSEEILRAVTDCVTIPMNPGVDSLNANVATAIFLYELTRNKGGRRA